MKTSYLKKRYISLAVAALFLVFGLTSAMAFDVSGTIYGSSTPLQNVAVTLTNVNTSAQAGAATTDAAGLYTIAGISDGTYDMAIVPPGASGYGSSQVNGIIVSGANVAQNVVLVQSAVILSGTVKTPGGVGISNIGVYLSEQASGTLAAQTVTDASGYYSVPLAGGTYRIDIFGGTDSGRGTPNIPFPQYLSSSNLLPNIVVGAATVQDITLPLVTLSGTTTDNLGAAVGNVALRVADQWVLQIGGGYTYYVRSSTTSDATGHYSLPLMAGSGYSLTLVPPSGSGLAQTVVNGVNVASDSTLNFGMAVNQYTLTFAAGPHGSISGTSPQIVNHGGSATAVTAVPATGYYFLDWTGTNGFVSTSANPLIISNVTASQNITANFAANSLTLTFAAGSGGTISGTSPQIINFGGSATAVNAVANNGYHFVNWTGDNGFVTTTANPLTVSNVTVSQNITANFAINGYTLTYGAGANGSISGASPQNVASGGSGTPVTAVANTGYHFVSWSDGVLTATRTDTSVTANLNVTASFAINSFTLTFAAGANGSISGASPQVISYGGNATAVSAAGNTGFHFVNWTGDNGFVASTANPLTVSNVAANQSIIANFAADVVVPPAQVTITFVAGSGGRVFGTLSQTIPYNGSTRPVVAFPNSGFALVNWTGTNGFVNTTTNPLTVRNAVANMTITANFSNTPLTLTFAAGANGSITGSAVQTVAPGGNSTPVTAIPNTGYHLVNWTGDNGFRTSTSNPLTVRRVTVSQNISANFAINQYTISFSAGRNGSISGNARQTVDYGGSTTAVTAVPAANRVFVNWTDRNGLIISTANPIILNAVTANQRIRANFR